MIPGRSTSYCTVHTVPRICEPLGLASRACQYAAKPQVEMVSLLTGADAAGCVSVLLCFISTGLYGIVSYHTLHLSSLLPINASMGRAWEPAWLAWYSTTANPGQARVLANNNPTAVCTVLYQVYVNGKGVQK